MDMTTDGRYRVLGRPRDPDELLLISVDDDGDHPLDAFEPTYVDTGSLTDAADATATADIADDVDALRRGMLVDATLEWTDGDPQFAAVDVVAETVFEFYDGVTGLFEAAKETWMVAEGDNAPMNGRVTKNTDGEPNGGLYVFAKQSGAQDLFEEFRNGMRPLEPLLRRADEGESVPPESEQPRAVFVLRPADEPFLVVYVVFRRDGVLAETMRSTYG
ncbi:DUF6663 family protein [Halobellus clavatus]|jgi:hypothetical protein|uniref:Uncharacterized protein n=1 Tax=Halobellus clavatus TaxID=660517 RepID=A0A1H3DDM2_9EURY|nr:DUF6663 family protein [Halobellus clavatus]SDX64457.1 hypothetical protein SAMN04487946_101507 [Halobellus clavatus]